MRATIDDVLADAWRRVWGAPTLTAAAVTVTVAVGLTRLTVVQSSSRASTPRLVPTLQALVGPTSNRGLIAAWAVAALALWLASAAMRGTVASATSRPERGVTASFADGIRLLPRYVWLVVLLSLGSAVVQLSTGSFRGLTVFSMSDALSVLMLLVASAAVAVLGVMVGFGIRDVVVGGRRASLAQAWVRLTRYFLPLVLAYLALVIPLSFIIVIGLAGLLAFGGGLRSTSINPMLIWPLAFISVAWFESVLSACWLDAERVAAESTPTLAEEALRA